MSVQYGYIPAPLAAYSTWVQNFSDVLNANPAAYMVSVPDAASVKVANDAFQAAYALSAKGSPATRTPTTVAATVSARVVLTALIRAWSSQIRLNPGVSDMDKTALGLRLPNNSPTPVPKPATWPVLAVRQYASKLIQLGYTDSSTPSLKAKPYGAIGGELYIGTGTAPITDPALCVFQGIFTRNYPTINFVDADVGKVKTFFARWVTRGAPHGSEESQVGPFSPGVSATVAG